MNPTQQINKLKSRDPQSSAKIKQVVNRKVSGGVLHCAKMFHPSTNQKQLPFSSRGCVLQVLSFTGLYSEENKWNKTLINLMRIIPQLHMPFKSTSNL